MSLQNLHVLAALLERERESLLSRWREQVRQLPSAKHLDAPTLNDHIPTLLDELVTALQNLSEKTIPEALLEGSPPAHGLQRHADGFDIVEIVAEYNILRGCIHDLAEDNGLSLQGKAFHILNASSTKESAWPSKPMPPGKLSKCSSGVKSICHSWRTIFARR